MLQSFETRYVEKSEQRKHRNPGDEKQEKVQRVHCGRLLEISLLDHTDMEARSLFC